MRVEIVAVGKLRSKPCLMMMQDYTGRLSHYLRLEQTELREVKAAQVEAILSEEALQFKRRLTPESVVVALDERGEEWTSLELSQRVEGWMNQSVRHVAFLIGSANGLDPSLRRECQHQLRLSSMTLPHELARVILAEQLYRAMTILRGEPYHR